jgi:hypothetical protein
LRCSTRQRTFLDTETGLEQATDGRIGTYHRRDPYRGCKRWHGRVVCVLHRGAAAFQSRTLEERKEGGKGKWGEIKMSLRELVEHKRKTEREAKRTQVKAQVDEISGSIYAPRQNEPGAYSSGPPFREPFLGYPRLGCQGHHFPQTFLPSRWRRLLRHAITNSERGFFGGERSREGG